MGMAVCKGILMVGEATQELLQLAHSLHPIPHEALADICHRLSQDAAKPFGHALRMAASKANDLQLHRRDKLVPDIKDFALRNTLKEAKLACDSFFAQDITPKVQEANSRCSQATLVSLASRARAADCRDNRERDSRPYNRPWGWGAGGSGASTKGSKVLQMVPSNPFKMGAQGKPTMGATITKVATNTTKGETKGPVRRIKAPPPQSVKVLSIRCHQARTLTQGPTVKSPHAMATSHLQTAQCPLQCQQTRGSSGRGPKATANGQLSNANTRFPQDQLSHGKVTRGHPLSCCPACSNSHR